MNQRWYEDGVAYERRLASEVTNIWCIVIGIAGVAFMALLKYFGPGWLPAWLWE